MMGYDSPLYCKANCKNRTNLNPALNYSPCKLSEITIGELGCCQDFNPIQAGLKR